MKCRRMIKDDKNQNYVVWFGAKQPKGTTNNNVRVLEFEETVEIDNWKFDVYTQNISNEVNLNLTEASGELSEEVDFWIPLEQTILSQSDVSFECQILDDTPRTADFMNVDISALPLTIDNLTPLEGSIIQLDTIKGRSVKWTQLVNPSGYASTQTVSGVTFTFNKTNGTITCNGTATEDITLNLTGGANYSFLPTDIIYLKGCPSGGSESTYYLRWDNIGMNDIGSGNYAKLTKFGSFTDTTNIWFQPRIVIKSGTTMTNKVFRPQLFNVSNIYGLGNEPSSIADFNKDYPYNIYPYGKQSILTTKVNGIKIRAGYKNLLAKDILRNSETINGITFKVDKDNGTITCNGTSTAKAVFSVNAGNSPIYSTMNHNKITWLIQGCPSGGSSSTYYLQGYYGNKDIGKGIKYELFSNGIYIQNYNGYPSIRNDTYIIIEAGVTLNNVVFKPQLINLTDTYGVGNEPTTVAQFNQDFPNIDDIPYADQTISFSEQTLYGINDAQDTLQVVKENNGYKLQKVENIGNVDMGSLSWSMGASATEEKMWYAGRYPNQMKIDLYYSIPNMLTEKYITMMPSNVTNAVYNKSISKTGSDNYVIIRDTTYTTAADLKTALNGQILYYAKRTPTITTIATLTKNQVTALFAKGYCVEIMGNDDNKVIVRPDLSLIFNEFEAPFGDGVYFGLGNKKSGWVDEDNLEAFLSTSTLQIFRQPNTEYDITHLRLQFLEATDISNNSSTPIIRFKISSKNKMNWYNEDDKHDNYAKEQEGVATSLTQRLSVIKNELWYNVNEGLPLIDKYRNKNIIDSYVASTILKHPDVINISEFTSFLNKNSYNCKVVINTTYGNVDLTI